MLQTFRERKWIKTVVLSAVLVVMVLGVGVGVTSFVTDIFKGKSSNGTTDSPTGSWALKIGSETITQNAFQMQLRDTRSRLQEMGMSQSPGFEGMALDTTIRRLHRDTIERAEALKAGLKVSDREVSDAILSDPGLQRDGRFIGREEYEGRLSRIGFTIGEFESTVRDSLLRRKWESMVGAGAAVTDTEVDEELARRNQKVRFDFVLVDASKFTPAAAITEEAITAHYASHHDLYQKGEARRARYVLIDTKASEAQLPAPSADEIKRAYDADRSHYPQSLQEAEDMVRRQILYQKSQAEADRRAANFRATVTDAASLEAAASKGGFKVQDTGSMRRDADAGELGPAFLDALFAAAPGTVSGPVKTLKGSIVFVLIETAPAQRATLAEARADVLADLSKEKGRDAALSAAKLAVGSAGGDLAKVAKAMGGTVQNGPLVSKGEPVPSIGYDPAVEAAAFATESGSIAAPVATSGGSIVVLKVAEKKTPEATGLAASREALRAELRRSRESALVNSILEAAAKRTEYKVNENYLKQFGS